MGSDSESDSPPLSPEARQAELQRVRSLRRVQAEVEEFRAWKLVKTRREEREALEAKRLPPKDPQVGVLGPLFC